nr:hypothetical protein [Luteimonas sp. XNQY3]
MSDCFLFYGFPDEYRVSAEEFQIVIPAALNKRMSGQAGMTMEN